jgi:acid phosphatase (class A)
MKLRVALLASLIFSGAVLAAEAPAVTHDYLAPNSVDFHALLPDPPADGSLAVRGELEVLHQLEMRRTHKQVVDAKVVEKQTIFTFASPILGPWFTDAKNFPRTAAVFAKVNAEARPVITAAKASWNRTRPYLADPTLHPCVAEPNNTSYPSGHSTDAALWGTVFAHLFPEHAADFERRVHDTMWGRMVGGVHYPSDTVSGRMLGEAIGREMLKSRALQKDLEDVRAELAPYLLKKAA